MTRRPSATSKPIPASRDFSGSASAMSESELRFRRLFETAQDGILLVNAKTGLIEEVNPYLLHLIGYSRTELLHKKIWNLGFLKDNLANKRNFFRLRRDRYIRYKDLPFERKDGTKLEVEFVSNVYRVGDEDIIQCNIRDNTARFRAEAAAKKISVDYADLYNHAPVGYHSFDRQGKIIRINDMELRMLGYRREEVVGRMKFSDFLTAPGRRFFRQTHLPTVMTKGVVSALRYEMVRKDGKNFIGLVNCKAMADKSGRFTVSNGTVADITELEQAEASRLASERRFRQLFETSQDGIVLVNATTGRIESVNPALVKLLGYSQSSLVGKKLQTVIFQNTAAGRENFRRLQRRHSLRIASLPVKTKRGKELLVEFVGNFYRVGDENIIQCNLRDITERRRAEAAVEKVSVDYSNLYNYAPIGYHSFDRQGTIIRINDMELRMLGYRREEVVGRMKFINFLTPAGRRFFRQTHLPTIVKKGAVTNLRYEMVRKDGTTFIGLVNAKSLVDSNGKFVASNGTTADITELERTEEARLSSERRFRQLFETSPDGLLLVDVATARIEDINPALVKLLGYSRTALLGKKIWTFAFLKNSLADRKNFRALRRHGSLDIAVVPIKTKRGRNLKVEFTSNVFRVGTQEIVKCNLRDVTARVHDAEVIWSNEERYRSIFDKGPLGMALSDMKANFFMVNDRFCRMLGYRQAELLKLTFRDITFPADLAVDKKNVALMQQGKLMTYATEKRYVKKDGGLMWAATHIQLIRDAAGVPQHFQVMIDDITKRKLAEEALQASLQKYLNLYDSMRDGIVRFDMKGRVMEANPAYQKMLGYSPEELKGLTYRQLTVKSFHAEQDRRLTEQLFMPDYQGLFEEDYVRKDGSIFNGSSNAWLDRDDQGLPESVWQITRDITDRKKLESIKSDFLTLANHQLRTPLSGHKWLLESLKSERLGLLNEAQKERLDSIYQLNQRMIDLVSEMMQVIHLESGKIDFQSQAVPLGPVIIQLLGLVGQSAERKRVRLDIAFDPLLAPKPKADPRWVQSILECLLANAIEYSPAGQSVTLTLTKAAKSVIIGVEDHGIGIPRSEQKNIFSRFYRASNAKELEPNGTGLGLSIAKMLAKEMKGEITFESQEGVGSTFRLRLPAA